MCSCEREGCAGSLVFLAVAPGVVAGLVPWWLTAWEKKEPLPGWALVRILGWVLVAAGVVVVLQAFARFVHEGLGTPAPVAPTERLVVGGLYRYVRNPMYLAVAATIVGQALVLGQPLLLLRRGIPSHRCSFRSLVRRADTLPSVRCRL